MNQLVFIKENKAVTDSLMISEKFRKSHDNVMRDIRQQIDKLHEAGLGEWSVLNFEETHYQHPQNKQWYSKFDLTEDAFAIVAMAYITPEAMKMKVKFLQEFKRMKEQIQNSKVIPLSKDQALVTVLRTTADLVEGHEKIVQRIEQIEQKVDEQITLDHGEQREVQKTIGKRVYELESDPVARKELFRQLHREIKDRWAVPSYRDVRRTELHEVVQYVNAWKPRKVS